MKTFFESIEDRLTKEERKLLWDYISGEENKIIELIKTKRQEGYKYGYEDGYEEAYEDGYKKGHEKGYEEGHEDGYGEALIQR